MTATLQRITQIAARWSAPALLRIPAPPAQQLHTSPHHPAQLKKTCLVHHHSCSTRYLSSVANPPDYNVNLSPAELSDILDKCNIVDVRQPEEMLEFGLLPGADNIPLGDLQAQLENIPDKNTVFICRIGIRSMKAVSLALQAGFENPRHLEGGMVAWNEVFHNK